MTDIHSCSYYCHKPECIKAQRDELRDKYIKPGQDVAKVTVEDFIQIADGKEDMIGTPIIWAQWPNEDEEKRT